MNKTNFLLKLLCLLALIYLTLFSIKWVPKITHGYAAYYTFSRMLVTGDDLSKGYNDDYFSSKINEYGMGVYDILAGNIPTNSFALAPFAWMDVQTARVVWSIFSIAAFMLSIYILFRIYELRFNTETGLLILLITILWRPVYENIAFGQIYAVLLLLFSIGMLGLKKRKNVLFTLPLSAVFLFKGYGVVNFLWLAVKKKWKELIYSTGFIIAGIIITIPLIGINTWKEYLSTVTGKMGQLPEMGNTAYQTFNSLLMHLFVFDQKWLPHPLVILPNNPVFIISILISLLFIAYILFEKNIAEEHLPLSFSAAIAAGVVTAPVAEQYHYLLFIPLVIGMSKILIEEFKEKRSIGIYEFFFVIAIAVMIAPLNYKSMQFSSFPVYLLAYPKLYAGIILLFIYKRIIRLQTVNTKEIA